MRWVWGGRGGSLWGRHRQCDGAGKRGGGGGRGSGGGWETKGVESLLACMEILLTMERDSIDMERWQGQQNDYSVDQIWFILRWVKETFTVHGCYTECIDHFTNCKLTSLPSCGGDILTFQQIAQYQECSLSDTLSEKHNSETASGEHILGSKEGK